jgi:polysaccharide export outer membrane protein
MRRKLAVLVLAVATLGATLSAHAQESVGSTQERERVPDRGEYRIGPADVLQIAVWKNEILSRSVPVRPDGMISLPLVNEVQAAGLTPMQLREALEKKLAEYIPNPEVSVIIQEVHSFTVSVLGEVKTAGRYELKSQATVLEVLARAGGITEFASRSRILILRPEGGSLRRISFNYDKVISAKGEHDNFFVQPGDIIVVP